MHRLLAIVLMWCGLVALNPASAQAAEAITLEASRPMLEHGQAVIFRGDVRAPRGSLVKLQRRVSGEWNSVARQTTSLRHRFRFEVVPPAGQPRYRVVKPGTTGSPRAVSDSLVLTVRWQPVLAVTSDTLGLDEYGNLTGSVLMEAAGAREVPDTEAWVELLDDTGEWTRVAPQYVFHGGLETFAWQLEHAKTYRSVIPGTGARMKAVSQPFTTPDPFVLPQNVTTEVTWPDDTPRTFAVDLVAGTEYGYHDVGDYASEDLVAPDGRHVTEFDHAGLGVRFTAVTTGRYLLVLQPRYATPAEITWSTTRVVPDVLDAGPLDVSGLPGQAVELAFTSPGGQFVSAYPGPMARFTLSGPGGHRIEWFDPLDLARPYWLLPEIPGNYRLRVLPDPHSDDGVELVDQQVMSAVERVVDLNDTDAEPVELDNSGRIAVLRTTVPDGVDLVLSTDSGNEPLDRVLIAPDGSQQRSTSQSPFMTVRDAEPGEYVLLASTPHGDSPPLTVSFFASTPEEYSTSTDAAPLEFDLGSIPHRHGSASFPLKTDQLVSLEIRNPDGSLCDTWQSWRSGPANVWVLNEMPTPVLGTADGTADIHFQACEQRGTLQFRPMVTSHLTPTGQPGTAVAPVRINEPGQMAMVTRDYNQIDPNRYRITGENAESTGTPHWALHMGWRYYDFSGMDLSVRIDNWAQAFLWTGDTGTGAMDLTFTYQSTW